MDHECETISASLTLPEGGRSIGFGVAIQLMRGSGAEFCAASLFVPIPG